MYDLIATKSLQNGDGLHPRHLRNMLAFRSRNLGEYVPVPVSTSNVAVVHFKRVLTKEFLRRGVNHALLCTDVVV